MLSQRQWVNLTHCLNFNAYGYKYVRKYFTSHQMRIYNKTLTYVRDTLLVRYLDANNFIVTMNNTLFPSQEHSLIGTSICISFPDIHVLQDFFESTLTEFIIP